jgi:hypothetical protein
MRAFFQPVVFLVAILSLVSCSDDNIIVAAPNNAPQIVITDPLVDESADPIEVQESLGLSVVIQVDDAEDPENQLLVTWGAMRTDDAGLEQDLGSLNPDPTGWAALQVIGLTGGNWRLWVRVTDTDGATDEVALLLFVVPANSPPLATEVLLGPEPAYEDTELVCEGVGWHDVDGDEVGWMVAWFVDGDPVAGQIGLSLDGDDFDKGQEVMCELTPFDGELLGEPLQSNLVMVLNSAPQPPTLEVEPAPIAEVDEVITCSVDDEAVDIDGDVVVVPDDYLVSWLVNGVAVSDLSGSWEVPSERTSLGEEWTCEVIATDGIDHSIAATKSTSILPDDGDLVITEVMARPRLVSDAAGEWIELYNASGRATSLLGFELYDDDGGSHIINLDVVVGPGEWVVLGRNADFSTNGGIAVDYEYSGIALDDTQDLVGLRFEGIDIDYVQYDLSPHAAWSLGRSLGLDPALPGLPSATLNDVPENWCMAGDLLGGIGSDFASPGAENGSCDCLLSDDDADGWGDDSSCIEPDCDDLEPLSYPGNPEVCDAIDNDCVGGVDDLFDEDADGVSTCGPDGIAGTSDDDCDDDVATGANTYPGNPEVCDGIDNDCIAGIDNGFDLDGDGVLTCGPDLLAGTADDDCDDDPATGANTYPGNTEVCDGVDNDCVGGVDDGFDDDGDGVTRCGPDGIYSNGDDDCDDAPATGANTYPGNAEVCDGIDNDCVGGADDVHDLDGDGVTTCGPDGVAGNADDDCDDDPLTGANTFPGNAEVCDGIDNDCLAGVDDSYDLDGDGVTTCGPDGIAGNGDDDCNDAPGTGASNFPGNPELCDGIDNDCDFASDEDFDLDFDGVTTCGPDNNFATSWDNDCDDGNAQRNPTLPEVCDPFDLDEDCDGTGDEAGAINCVAYYTDADNDTWGVGSSQCLCSTSGWLRATRSGDCFDSNGYALPGQSSWFPAHRGDNNWDYNCDGQQTKRWTQTSGNCAFFSDLCSGGDGWRNGTPSCGSTGNWGTGCYYSTSGWPWDWGCYFNSSVPRTQECR